MLSHDDVVYLEKNLPYWKNLTDEEERLLINSFKKVKYNRGDHLHSAGKECLGHLVVKEGELRAYMLSEEGRDITLFRLPEGESCVLSASCILSNITFEVLIDAEQDAEIYLLNVGTFNKLTQENIYVENYMYKKAADRFSDVMWAMEQILFMSFDKRLAVFLYDEMVKTKSNKIKLTHEQIAKYIGSAREVVSRMLKSFETHGILKLSRGTIEIVDKNVLRGLIQK